MNYNVMPYQGEIYFRDSFKTWQKMKLESFSAIQEVFLAIDDAPTVKIHIDGELTGVSPVDEIKDIDRTLFDKMLF